MRGTRSRTPGLMHNDVQIAALCEEHDVSALLTADRDFDRLPGLRSERLEAEGRRTGNAPGSRLRRHLRVLSALPANPTRPSMRSCLTTLTAA